MLEFKGFHPKDVTNEIALKFTDSGVHYENLESGAFQFIPYPQIAGYSGWQPGYGSLHIYSTNPNLTMHLNFPAEIAEQSLKAIQNYLAGKTEFNSLAPQTSQTFGQIDSFNLMSVD